MATQSPDLSSQWKAFSPQQRDSALSRMTPEQKSKLATSLGYKPPAANPKPSINPEPRTVGNYLKEGAFGVGRGLRNDAKGIYSFATENPFKSIQDMESQTEDAVKAGAKEFTDTKGAPWPQRLAAGALTGLEQAPMVGNMVQHAEQGGERMASPEGFGAAVEGITTFEAPGLAVKGLASLPRVARGGIRAVSGTGSAVGDLVKRTKAENASAASDASAENAATAAKRDQDVRKFGEKRSDVRAGNEEKEGVASRKEALNRGVERLDTEFQDDLKKTAKDVKAKADSKYEDVRKALGPKADAAGNEISPAPTTPSADLAGAVKSAEGKISGSNESIKIFKDILSKHPESDPDFVTYQGAQIPRGHNLYEVLKQQGEIGVGNGATFSDLQGYYSELGEKLSTGNLPGDVYQAMKGLHEDIGAMMQKMADGAGVGEKLSDARNFYRGYMETFRTRSSPIYKAIKAQERGKSIASFAGKDQTGIQALARYNPELARRANTIRGYSSEASGLRPSATRAPEPVLPPKPATVLPKVNKIGAEEVKAAKTGSLQKRADWIRHRGQWAATFPLLYELKDVLHGNVGGLPGAGLDASAVLGATHGLAALLERPAVTEFLSKATAKDIEAIPADLRGDFPDIVKAAKKRGIPISPAVTALLQGAGADEAGRKRVASALKP